MLRNVASFRSSLARPFSAQAGGASVYVPPGIVLLCSALTRFAWFGRPQAAVIDEVYFAQYLSGYLTGQFQFDLHPPLGKLLVALLAKLAGVAPTLPGTPWNTDYVGTDYLFLRLGPCLVGTLVPLVIYALARELFQDRALAFCAGTCAAFDNALVTQSRFLFFDGFLLFFGVSSLTLFVRYRRTGQRRLLLFAGACAGASGCVKWTGLSFVALPVALEYLEFMLGRVRLRDVARVLALLVPSAGACYAGIFALHIALLPDSGAGDAFMSPAFQKTLHGSAQESAEVAPASPIAQFTELHRVMFDVNDHVGDHPYGSRFYEWPLNRKGVGYFRRGNDDIVLVGNDLLWWSSSAAVLALLIQLFVRPALWRAQAVALISVGYLVNWLPFAAIKRVMFIHHYLVALVFALLALGYWVGRVGWLRQRVWIVIVSVIVGFIAQARATYGGVIPW